MALTFPESSGAPEPIQPQPEGEGKAICEDTMCRIPGKIKGSDTQMAGARRARS
jgi:hypothetical protein